LEKLGNSLADKFCLTHTAYMMGCHHSANSSRLWSKWNSCV